MAGNGSEVFRRGFGVKVLEGEHFVSHKQK
jgi:hypothetical protein